MGFGIALLVGVGVGVVIVPIGFMIIAKIRDAKQRRFIKRQLHEGKFLKPFDKKDFDIEMWKDKVTPSEIDKEELSDKIFRRGKFKPSEDEI
jgi:hypothetical protein